MGCYDSSLTMTANSCIIVENCSRNEVCIHSPLHRDSSSDASWLIWVICTLITCLFGSCANATLLAVNLTYRKIRTLSSAALIVHCLALDLYISTVVAPVDAVLGYLGPGHCLPRQFCRFYGLGFYNVYYIHVW